MKSNYERLGDHIRQVDERNKDLRVKKLLGVSITKKFIESIANLVGTEMDSYKVVHRNQFAYGPVTSRNGEKVSIALLETVDECIISNSYAVFEITNAEKLLPEYLMLWFKRPDFDRYARFKSHGSVREIFDWAELCNVELPILSVDKQKEVIEAYNSIEKRIKIKRQINDNLEATAHAVFKSWFLDFEISNGEQPDAWKIVTLSDISIQIVTGNTPSTAIESNYGDDIPFITIPDMHRSVFATKTQRSLSAKGAKTQANRLLPPNSVCVSCIATAGLVCLTAGPSQTNQQINSIICKDNICYCYVYLKMVTLSDYIKRIGSGGSTTCNVNKTDFSQIEILLPDDATLSKFHNKVEPLFASIRANQYEIQSFNATKSILLARISS